jgi:uncharacterized protein YoxC
MRLSDEELEQLTEALEEVALDLNVLSGRIKVLEDHVDDLLEIAKALLTQRLN